MGERTEEMYLLEPAPPGDCVGQAGAGECIPGRMIPELAEGEGLESGMWYDAPPLPPPPPPPLSLAKPLPVPPPELVFPLPALLLLPPPEAPVPDEPPDLNRAGECPGAP